MHYELWDSETANVIDIFPTEAEALATVRLLLAAGWDAEHLTLGLDFDEGEDGDDDTLPDVVYGTALAERALAAAADPARP